MPHCRTRLIESELFGYEKGAFTNAAQKKVGRFELAHSGTLFLDEIGELNLSTQAKFLRAIEQETFTRLGGTDEIKVDVRIIAASNRDLETMAKAGSFARISFTGSTSCRSTFRRCASGAMTLLCCSIIS